MIVADGLVLIWRQDVCNNHDDVGWSAHMRILQRHNQVRSRTYKGQVHGYYCDSSCLHDFTSALSLMVSERNCEKVIHFFASNVPADVLALLDRRLSSDKVMVTHMLATWLNTFWNLLGHYEYVLADQASFKILIFPEIFRIALV